MATYIIYLLSLENLKKINKFDAMSKKKTYFFKK